MPFLTYYKTLQSNVEVRHQKAVEEENDAKPVQYESRSGCLATHLLHLFCWLGKKLMPNTATAVFWENFRQLAISICILPFHAFIYVRDPGKTPGAAAAHGCAVPSVGMHVICPAVDAFARSIWSIWSTQPS